MYELTLGDLLTLMLCAGVIGGFLGVMAMMLAVPRGMDQAETRGYRAGFDIGLQRGLRLVEEVETASPSRKVGS